MEPKHRIFAIEVGELQFSKAGTLACKPPQQWLLSQFFI